MPTDNISTDVASRADSKGCRTEYYLVLVASGKTPALEVLRDFGAPM